MKLSDSLRRTAISVCSGEEFDTGKPAPLIGTWMAEFGEAQFDDQRTVEMTELAIECVTTDVRDHGLIRGSVIRRVADDTTYRVKRLEQNENGFTTIRLMA